MVWILCSWYETFLCRKQIKVKQYRIQFDISPYPLQFFSNTPFNKSKKSSFIKKVISWKCRHIYPGFLCSGTYFDRYKGFGNAICLAGNCLGGMVLPFLFTYLYQTFGYSGAHLILGKFPLVCFSKKMTIFSYLQFSGF